jgi:hypothetical protein
LFCKPVLINIQRRAVNECLGGMLNSGTFDMLS